MVQFTLDYDLQEVIVFENTEDYINLILEQEDVTVVEETVTVNQEPSFSFSELLEYQATA